MDYRKEIDGLRAVAVLPVLLFHAGLQGFDGGFLGVDVFFVISGYLITTIIVNDIEAGRYSIARFYERRARRILPALFLVVLVTTPLAFTVLLPSQLLDFGFSILSVVSFVSNIFFWKQGGYFTEDLEKAPLLHTWSLAVEEQYYILFPILAVLLVPRSRGLFLASLIAVGSISLMLAEYMSRVSIYANYYLLPTRAWELMIGAVCSMVLIRKQLLPNPWLSAIGAGMLVYAFVTFGRQTPFPSLYGLIPTVGTALIILFSAPSNLVGRLLGLRPVVIVGLASYSIYLWHQPLLALARAADIDSMPVMLGCLVASVAAGWGSWKYLEAPFRDARRMSLRALTTTLGVMFLVLLVVAAGIVHQKGFLGRYSEDDRWLASLDTTTSGQYVMARFTELQNRDWDVSGERLRTLVIGDSFAQDFTNVLGESRWADNLDVSTFYVRPGCGNLITEEDLSRYRSEILHRQCQSERRYDDPSLLRRLAEADRVFLASYWSDWEVERLAESLEKLRP